MFEVRRKYADSEAIYDEIIVLYIIYYGALIIGHRLITIVDVSLY